MPQLIAERSRTVWTGGRPDCTEDDCRTAKNMYMDAVRRSGLYGCVFYEDVEPVDVYEELPRNLAIGVNEWGVHILDANPGGSEKRHLMTFDYYDVKKWTTSSTQLALHLGSVNDRVKFVFSMPAGKPKEAANFMKVYVSIQASRPNLTSTLDLGAETGGSSLALPGLVEPEEAVV